MSATTRSFLALSLPDEARAAASTLQGDLRGRVAPRAVKWVAPENIHLTLKFLGEIAQENVPRVIAILRQCVEGVAPFEVEVKGAGAFPTPRRPRVLFVDAHDEPPILADIANRLNDAMTAADVPREDRGFRNHVTIGRVRKPSSLAETAAELGKSAERSFGTMSVEEAVLMKSDLRPDGPVYTPVERIALKATA